MRSPAVAQHAGLWTRVWATLIDTALLAALTWPVLIAIYGPGYFAASGGFQLAGVWELILAYLLPPVAALAFWVHRGATPGKAIGFLRIVDARTGGAPPVGRLVLRLLGYLVSAAPLGAGFVWIAFDRRKQGFHDKLAGTVVVDRLATALHAPAAAEARGRPEGDGPDEVTSPSSTTAGSPAAAVADPSPVRLAAFRAGASALLLATAAGGIHRLTRKAEIFAARTSETGMRLREAGVLTPTVDEVLFYTRGAGILLGASIALLLVWRAAHRPAARQLALVLGFFFFTTPVLALLGIDSGTRELIAHLSSWLALAALLRFVTIFPRELEASELTRRRRRITPGPIRRTIWRIDRLARGIAARVRGAGPEAGDGGPATATSGEEAVLAAARAWTGARRPRRLAALLLSPRVVWTGAVLVPLLLHLAAPLGDAVGVPTVLGIMALLVTAMWLLRLNMRGAAAPDRDAGLWVVYGLLLAIGTPIALGLLGLVVGVALNLAAEAAGLGTPILRGQYVGFIVAIIATVISPLILTVAVAFAVLYRGAIDPGLAIRKTTVYGLLGIFAMLVFAGIEQFLSNTISTVMPLPDGVRGLAAAGLSAAAIGLVRHRLRRRTDRVFDRILPAGAGKRGTGKRDGRGAVLASDLVLPPDASGISPKDLVALSVSLARHAQRLAANHGGGLLDSVADGVLLEVATVRGALQAARALDMEIAREAASRGLSGVRLATGIHAGTIRRDDGEEAAHPTVDVALRVLRLAQPGGVVLSEDAAVQIADLDAAVLEPITEPEDAPPGTGRPTGFRLRAWPSAAAEPARV